jgi:hypothetical protein
MLYKFNLKNRNIAFLNLTLSFDFQIKMVYFQNFTTNLKKIFYSFLGYFFCHASFF